MRQRSGYTLIEVLVAAAMASLILTSIYSIFVQGLRLYALGQARADLLSSALVATARMSRELRPSSAGTLTVWCPSPAPSGRADAAVAFRVPSNPDSVVAYTPGSSCVVYFRDQVRGALVRKTASVNGTGRVDVDTLKDICNTADSSEQVVTPYLKSFVPEASSPNSLTLRLTMERRLNSTRSVRAQVATSVFFRNR